MGSPFSSYIVLYGIKNGDQYADSGFSIVSLNFMSVLIFVVIAIVRSRTDEKGSRKISNGGDDGGEVVSSGPVLKVSKVQQPSFCSCSYQNLS